MHWPLLCTHNPLPTNNQSKDAGWILAQLFEPPGGPSLVHWAPPTLVPPQDFAHFKVRQVSLGSVSPQRALGMASPPSRASPH